MTIVIEISDELHAKLAAKARSAGTNVITYIQQVLTTEARALDKIRGR
jgi:predicted HicB family RNase H-like nuclease